MSTAKRRRVGGGERAGERGGGGGGARGGGGRERGRGRRRRAAAARQEPRARLAGLAAQAPARLQHTLSLPRPRPQEHVRGTYLRRTACLDIRYL